MRSSNKQQPCILSNETKQYFRARIVKAEEDYNVSWNIYPDLGTCFIDWEDLYLWLSTEEPVEKNPDIYPDSYKDFSGYMCVELIIV